MKKILLFIAMLTVGSAQAQFWTAKSTGFSTTSRGVDNISIVDANVIWAKAYDGAAPIPPATTPDQTVKEFTRSIDGGNTWNDGIINLGAPFATDGLGISSITAVSASTAWVSAYPATGDTGGIWKTTNSGATWVKQTTATFSAATSFANLVHFFDANNGIAQGDPANGYFEIYTTNDGGTNWVRVPQGNIPAQLTDEYGYVHNYDTVGDIIWFGTSRGRLYKSTNRGVNWTVSQTPLTDFGGAALSGSYSFSNATKGILTGSNNTIYTTADGGVTYVPLVPNTPYGRDNIEYIPNTSIIVSTSPGAAGPPVVPPSTYYSLNDGLNWTEVQSGTQITELEFLSNTIGFGGGFTTNPTTGGIYKYTGTQLAVSSFGTSQLVAFPNPTTGLLQLEGIALNEVAVFDLLGKNVLTVKYAALTNVSVDLSALQTGAYILQATSDQGTIQTLKIMKQ